MMIQIAFYELPEGKEILTDKLRTNDIKAEILVFFGHV